MILIAILNIVAALTTWQGSKRVGDGTIATVMLCAAAVAVMVVNVFADLYLTVIFLLVNEAGCNIAIRAGFNRNKALMYSTMIDICVFSVTGVIMLMLALK